MINNDGRFLGVISRIAKAGIIPIGIPEGEMLKMEAGGKKKNYVEMPCGFSPSESGSRRGT